jgi:hypothetical protein
MKGAKDMELKKLDLQQFAGSLTVTVNKDGHTTTATASPSSSLAKGDTVTLTLAFDTGYELDEIETIAGGVTVDPETKTFKMDESNVILYVKSKKNNMYLVTENTYVNVNGTATELKRNIKLAESATGAIVGVESDGTAVTVSADVVASLVKQGVLVKI